MSILIKALIFLGVFCAILGYSCVVVSARYDKFSEEYDKEKSKNK